MTKRKQISWDDWSKLPSDERKVIRKRLLKRYRSDMESKHCAGMNSEEHKIMMIPAPEDEQAIIEAVAADLRNYMRGNFDKAVKEEQNA